MKKLVSIAIFGMILSSTYCMGIKYTLEFQQAYKWAYDNGITTKSNIDSANIGGEITRAELAKMISNYAKNVLGMNPDTSKQCLFINSNIEPSLVEFVTESCQLGLMGQGISDFRPNDSVTRAEFGTVLSRMLFNTEDGEYKYYSTHLTKLKSEGIITNDNPSLKELRGYVMLMLMRSQEPDTTQSYNDKNYTEYYDIPYVLEMLD